MHNRTRPDPTTCGAATGTVYVTFFKDFAAERKTTENLTLDELAKRVLKTSRREKGNLPWLELAVFGDKKTDEGCPRHNENVHQITGVELDYDDKKISFDAALTALREMGISPPLHLAVEQARRPALACSGSDIATLSEGDAGETGGEAEWLSKVQAWRGQDCRKGKLHVIAILLLRLRHRRTR